ncbi:MAG: 2,3-bisphosphoglycerate-independent phosphoglycerate mutase [Alteromonas naphthalenivorans]|jgi:2,3-bisphosphoglycerate-independent phosphoglycerate mutase
MKNSFPTALIILDGFGYKEEEEGNAIAQASMPTFSKLLSTYPATTLKASGASVGLPDGYNGNSEVGHLTLGCGTVVPQSLTLVEKAIEDGSFYKNQKLKAAFVTLKDSGKTLHLMGLLSDGGVHSSLDHLFAFLKMAAKEGVENIVIHGFLDGRDTIPHSAENYLALVEKQCKTLGIGIIGSLHGRFYAMDRNKNWQQTEKSYLALTSSQENKTQTWQEYLKEQNNAHPSEEFFDPVQLNSQATIKTGDGVIFFNIRADRARQLTSFFLDGNTLKNEDPLKLAFFITPVSYGPDHNTITLFERPETPQTLTQFLHDQDYSIFTIAETEKYAHITYFFNGGREEKLTNETRVLVPSITREKYDKFPEMSAPTITQATLESLKTNPQDLYIINYANADMVGHTGDFNATLKALECLDTQLKELINEIVVKQKGIVYITSDHGNAEEMIDGKTKQPLTSHTQNPVFFIMVTEELKDIHLVLPLHQLSDVAPFIAQVMLDGLQTSLR